MFDVSSDRYPYNDRYFLRRCVAIWEQNGPHAPVTWAWPEALACPDFSTSKRLLAALDLAVLNGYILFIFVLFCGFALSVRFSTPRRHATLISTSEVPWMATARVAEPLEVGATAPTGVAKSEAV